MPILNIFRVRSRIRVGAYRSFEKNIEVQLPEGEPQHQSNEKKKAKRMEALEKKLEARGDILPKLRIIYQETSQLSLIFYRWLRKHLHDPAPWTTAQSRLTTLYANF